MRCADFKLSTSYFRLSPDIPLFKKFQEQWPNINETNYESAITDRKLCKIFDKDRESILVFIEKAYLTNLHPREDYKEFLQLTALFLGKQFPTGLNVRAPGAYHPARYRWLK